MSQPEIDPLPALARETLKQLRQCSHPCLLDECGLCDDAMIAALRQAQQVQRERDAQFVEDFIAAPCPSACVRIIAATLRSQEIP